MTNHICNVYIYLLYALVYIIGTFAFQYCSLLSKVILTNGIFLLGNYMFQMTSNSPTLLSSIMIPSTITYIANYVFIYCSGITKIEFVDGLTVLGNFMFQMSAYPTLLSVITIPSSLTFIGNFNRLYVYTIYIILFTYHL